MRTVDGCQAWVVGLGFDGRDDLREDSNAGMVRWDGGVSSCCFDGDFDIVVAYECQ